MNSILNLTIFGGLMLVTARVGMAQSADDWQQWTNLLKRYVAASEAGKWDAATRDAEQIQTLVLKRFPERLGFLGTVWLAQARNGQGKFGAALSLYEVSLRKSQKFQPQNDNERRLFVACVGEALRGKGVSLERLGCLNDAVPIVAEAVKWLEQNNPVQAAAETRVVLGHLLQRLGDHTKASNFEKQSPWWNLRPPASERPVLAPLPWQIVFRIGLTAWSTWGALTRPSRCSAERCL